MPPASQYQHVFRINKPENINNGGGAQAQTARTRRNRQTLSCDACRARKLKCDRQSPCAPCSRRGDVAAVSCNYSKSEKDNGHGTNTSTNSTRAEAQIRLQKLEELVTGLMQATPSSDGADDASNNMAIDHGPKEVTLPSPSSSEQSGSLLNGHLNIDGLESHYHGATHWTTILENIQDIRGLVDSAAESSEDSPSFPLVDAPDVVFATTQHLTMEDFLEALPPRAKVDNLVSTYLTSDGIRAPHIHSRKFLREYRVFWNDPHSTSFLWISMLFSVLWTTLYFGPSKRESTNQVSFFSKAGQALVAGGYHKARPYSADAALLYALCSFYMSKQEGDTDCWLIMGIATRLAVKMGYHRDPKHLLNISPFEGEMRRRCFFLLDAFDVLLSNQYGLPAILQEEDCDTETPRNLRDEDLEEDCGSLPSSRPSTEATPMLYFCFKSRFAKAHKRAIRHALALERTPYATTLQLDAELHANDADVPRSLQMASLDELLLDQPWQTLQRMHIKFQYLRSLCVLHRKYLSQGRTNPECAYSRKICIDASLQLLRYQADIYLASRSGGRFFENKSMLSMLTQHHFLLAAMIICLDLYECHDQKVSLSPEDLESQIRKHDALTMSNEVWKSRSQFSRDAQRAAIVVSNMLSRVPRPNLPLTIVKNISEMRLEPSHGLSKKATAPNSSEVSMTGCSSNTNDFTPWNPQSVVGDLPVLPFDSTDTINQIFDGTENIDWVGVQSRNGSRPIDSFLLGHFRSISC